MSGSLPVTALTALDPVLRDTTSASVLLDAPGVVVVRHDLSGAGEGTIRRVVSDLSGVLEDERVPLQHVCLSCALREDLVPTLLRLEAVGRWHAAVLALPLAAEPAPVAAALHGAGIPLAGLVSLVDAAALEHDLLGSDVLADRGLAVRPDDRRAVGEVLAHQVEAADLVLAAGPAGGAGVTLLRHLAGPDRVRVGEIAAVSGADLLDRRHDPARLRRGQPLRVEPPGAADDDGVWTLDLADWRPLHPRRLLQRIEELGGGRLRGRGRFWLPTRPGTVAAWDGAGGQLSVGSVGQWDGAAPSTRIVVTGIGPADRRRVQEAFDAVLLTDRELARGAASWLGVDDGFEPWLGERSQAA